MTTLTATVSNPSEKTATASMSFWRLNMSAFLFLGKSTLGIFLSPLLLVIGLMHLVVWFSK